MNKYWWKYELNNVTNVVYFIKHVKVLRIYFTMDWKAPYFEFNGMKQEICLWIVHTAILYTSSRKIHFFSYGKGSSDNKDYKDVF